MKIAVSGAAGFVGKALISRLNEIDGLHSLRLVRSRDDEAQTIAIGDLGNEADPISLPPLDTLVHLAAVTHSGGTDGDPAVLARYRAINVQGTQKLLSAAAAAGVRHFIFMSSIKVNGERTLPGKAFTELDEPAPEDVYGKSKLEAEWLVRRFCQDNGMDWTIIRPPLVYGAEAAANFKSLKRLAISGLPLPFGRFDAPRSFIFVRNLADFVTTVILDRASRGRIFLVSDGEDVSVSAMVRILAGQQGKSPYIFALPNWMLSLSCRLPGVGPYVAKLSCPLQIDPGFAQATLGWTPPFPLRQALSQTMNGQAVPDSRR